ncbi:MAG: phosphonate transport system permease protein [Erysipelotrichaceae bacterium]|nr:MAG: phosphonate transport system permease [Erysipelotrichaceae bacterium]TXT19835.1 MAG: phosphonate transport system permease protein [Erysipelotrichaceae bacterium]
MTAWLKEVMFPSVIFLANGKSTKPKRSPMVYVVPILLVLILISMEITGFDFIVLFTRGYQFFVIVGRMIPPDFGYIPKLINPMIETIMMSIIGTLVGAFFALPLAFLSSDNIIKNKIFLWVNRFVFSIFRTLPILIIALFGKYVFGLGSFAGTIAIAFFTWLIMTKMLYELIETIDMGPFEAVESSGAGRIKTFWVTILPQILGQFISFILYNFEMNVRSAAILGYVGAGGIGLLLNEKLGWREYDKVGMILLTLLITVYAIETFSRMVRKKLS